MRRRKGFTITELLVAMALIVFIMYILAEAFSAGSTAFRNLKAIGDMNEKLRGTSQTLRRFLQADHFEDRKRVSDPDFWKDGPPRAGFLRIYNGSPGAYEGNDLDGNVSFRSVDHGLHFAVKLRGNNRGDYFRSSLPANSPLLLLPLQDTRFQETPGTTLNSSWGEVAVFLVASGDQTEDPEGTTAPQPLYALYLRQRALVPDNQLVSDLLTNTGQGRIAGSSYPQYVEMSCHKDPTGPADPNSVLYFNGPADVTMPARRMGGTPGSPSDLQGSTPPNLYPTLASEPGGLLAGNDVLMTNVLSFDVRVLLDRGQWAAYNAATNQNLFYDFVTLDHGAIQWFTAGGGNPTFTAANGPRVFDTWSQAKDDWQDYGAWATGGQPTSIPLFQNANGQKIRIVAIQITMRIWDANTKQTRQSSVVVDL